MSFKKHFILLAIFCLILVNGQTILVKDSITKEPISYAELLIDGNMFYSDSLGTFNFNDNFKKFSVKKSGFNQKEIQNYAPEIFLSPKIYDIPVVDIKKKELRKIYDKLKNNSTHTIPIGFQWGFIIKNPNKSDGVIKEIMIPVKKVFDNDNANLIIEFFNISNGEIEDEPIPYSSIVIKVNDLTKKKNTINIQKNGIVFPEEGIFISLRVMESNGKFDVQIDKPSVTFYNSKRSGYYYIRNWKHNNWAIYNLKMNYIGIALNVLY